MLRKAVRATVNIGPRFLCRVGVRYERGRYGRVRTKERERGDWRQRRESRRARYARVGNEGDIMRKWGQRRESGIYKRVGSKVKETE